MFGAATEWFANNPNDPPDYTVGEEVNLVGSGPIRYMYNPSLAGRRQLLLQQHPDARGARGRRSRQPLVLPARRGHQPGNGQPASPTCNGTLGRPASASRRPARSCTTRCC